MIESCTGDNLRRRAQRPRLFAPLVALQGERRPTSDNHLVQRDEVLFVEGAGLRRAQTREHGPRAGLRR